MTNIVACDALTNSFSFICLRFVRYRFGSRAEANHFVGKWHFANGFRCATNDDCHRRKLSPQRICRHSHLIQFSDRLIVPLCVCLRRLLTFVLFRYNAIEGLCACCPKRPPANRIMGRIIYKEIYNLTKAKVKKYIIAIEIVFYCVSG